MNGRPQAMPPIGRQRKIKGKDNNAVGGLEPVSFNSWVLVKGHNDSKQCQGKLYILTHYG